jgi:hypothetical protein
LISTATGFSGIPCNAFNGQQGLGLGYQHNALDFTESINVSARLQAFYKVHGDATSIKSRAQQAIANEQSVETPLAAIRNPLIVSEIAGQVAAIEDQGRRLVSRISPYLFAKAVSAFGRRCLYLS